MLHINTINYEKTYSFPQNFHKIFRKIIEFSQNFHKIFRKISEKITRNFRKNYN